jgi:type IV pilus assembly protein PilW
MGMIELLVVMLISLLLLSGLFSIVYGTRQNFLAQNQLGQLQDSERLAMSIITNVLQTGGYYANPTTTTKAAALPAANVNGAVFAVDQSLYGLTNGGTGDQVWVRYVAGVGDGVLDCNGQSNQTGAAQTDVNLFYVANNTLYCQVSANGVAQTAQPLVNGVTAMSILYGVDTNSDNSADEYMTAANVTAGTYWNKVVSVRVQLSFSSPLSGVTAPGNGPAPTPTLTRTIDMLNTI